jgi:tetratricopeptide (TPR) repeat protein
MMMGLLSQAAFGQDPAPAPGKPGDAEAWYKSAYDKRHTKDLDGAIADATEAIKLSPKTGKYWLERGISRGNKGDLDGALDDFNHAVPLAPENADALRIRGLMKGRMKDFDGAMEDFAAAVRISPKFSRAYGDRGDTYRQMGKRDLALADYNRALEIDKKYFWFCEARGDILRSQAKPELAAADYRSALETAKEEAVRSRLERKLAALALPAPQAVSIFDGKTLEGWEGDEKVWKVVDGAIVGGSLEGNKQNEFLATKKSYKDFVLKLEYKLTGTEGFINSGVQIRSRRTQKPPNEMKGYQADIGKGYTGSLYDESRRNKALIKPEPGLIDKIEKLGDWNLYEIRCEGLRVVLKGNGTQTIDYTEEAKTLEQEGLIGLQIHGGAKSQVFFRNITIEELGEKK